MTLTESLGKVPDDVLAEAHGLTVLQIRGMRHKANKIANSDPGVSPAATREKILCACVVQLFAAGLSPSNISRCLCITTAHVHRALRDNLVTGASR